MRTIKYKAWNNETNSMHEVGEISFNEDGSFGGVLEGLVRRFYFNERVLVKGSKREWIDDVILLQYTGLKDIKNKEIYEGDILKYLNYKGYEEIIEVWWDNDMAGFNFGNRNLSFIKNKLEIIGNIYENPELLEVEQC